MKCQMEKWVKIWHPVTSILKLNRTENSLTQKLVICTLISTSPSVVTSKCSCCNVVKLQLAKTVSHHQKTSVGLIMAKLLQSQKHGQAKVCARHNQLDVLVRYKITCLGQLIQSLDTVYHQIQLFYQLTLFENYYSFTLRKECEKSVCSTNAVTKISFSGSPFKNLWYILKYMESQLNKKNLDCNISANAQRSCTLSDWPRKIKQWLSENSLVGILPFNKLLILNFHELKYSMQQKAIATV